MLRNVLSLFILSVTLIVTATSVNGERNNLIRFDSFFGGPLHKTSEPYTLAGQVAYIGSEIFESVYLNWQAGEDGEIHTAFFDDIGLYPQIPFRFQAPEKWIPQQNGNYTLYLWFSGLNGEEQDVPASVVREVHVEVYDNLVPRELALLESFSSINCGSCALVTPILRQLIDNDPERYHQIYYHPLSHEGSPLYQFNPKDHDIRNDLYEIFYTPVSAVGGIFFGGSELLEEQLLELELDKWSGFDLSGEWFVHENLFYFQVQGEVLINLDNPEKDLRLLVAAEQDSLFFETPPGSNNEKDFFSVMRFFAPDANGIRLTPEHHDSINITMSIPWYPELEIDRMTLILFVQDLQNSEIYQAARMVYNQFMEPEEPDDPTFTREYENGKFNVYPNPASHLLMVESPGEINIEKAEMYDTTGNLVRKTGKLSNHNTSIDLTGLPAGLYVLVLWSDHQPYTYRISVVH